MSIEDNKLDAWEYSQGKWHKIVDPCKDAFEKLNEDYVEALKHMGYRSEKTLGVPDNGSYGLSFYYEPINAKTEYPFLVCLNINDYPQNIYIKELPDFIQFTHLCSTTILADILSMYHTEYSDVLEYITRDITKQINQEHRERRARQTKG